jgi:glycosyltransferase involved in cell wall biosynthesis
MPPRLTIAVPTFDRNDLLREHVRALVPQLTDDVRLVILDNASPTPAAETLAPVLAEHPAAPVTLVRHRVNIGSSANVMRCLEVCATPWLWTLGDDDRPLPGAVAAALAAIDRHADCLLISFSSMVQAVEAERRTDGLDGFSRDVPHFANLTLISNNLVRADRLSPHARVGYFYAYSLYPHLACLLAELNANGGACVFSPQRLVEWGPRAHWSRVMAGAGMGVIMDLPVPDAVRRRLAPWLVGVSGRYSSLAVHLMDQIGTTIDAPTARYLFAQGYYRLYRYDRRPWHWLVRQAGRLVLRFPALTKSVYRRYRRLRGNPLPDKPRDEMRRM